MTARLAIALASVLLGLAACGASEPKATEPAEAPVSSAPAGPLVETQRAELGTVSVTIEASGEIRARRVSGIGAEVGGRLVRVFVDVGDVVAEGAPLFQIDPEPYETILDEARAGLAVARAERDQALQERDRVETLVAREALSAQRGDQQRTTAAMAIANVAQMEARVERAASDLSRTRVTAPYPAAVVERRAHEGEMAGPTPVVVLQESGALVAVLHIPETAPLAIPSGAPVRLHLEGIEHPLESQIDVVSRRVDPQARTYEVRATVTDASGRVKAGSYARAQIDVSSAQPGPVVDRSAIVLRDGASYVFRVEGDTARRVAVRVGPVTPERAQILAGIEPGDEIVRGDAASRLVDGEPVRRAEGPGRISAREVPAP